MATCLVSPKAIYLMTTNDIRIYRRAMIMETFATVDKTTIVNSRGVKYIDFRNRLVPKYGRAWVEIFSGYFALAMVLLITVYAQNVNILLGLLTIPIGGLLVGYIVASLHLFIHEASHYHLAADKKRNDLLSNIVLGLLVGMDVDFYRTVHFAHHRLIGTAKDTEKSYFDAISWRFMIETLSGIRVLKVIAHRHENIKVNEGHGVGSGIIRKNNLIFFVAAGLNLLLVIGLVLTGYWQAAVVWFFGMGSAFPFFASFRQILEHRRVGALATTNYHEVDHGAAHRMFGDGLIGSTMGSAGFNRHLIHHWDPQVSYTRLKDVEEFLYDTPLAEELKSAQTTYFKTFIGLLNK